jgi:hypothetical protein
MSKVSYDPEKPEIVYMVPAHGNREIRYIESIERAGIITDLKHGIAMYTSRSIPNVGPQGPPGPEGPEGPTATVYDTIIASCSDEETELTVDLVNAKTTFRAPYALNMNAGYVRISLTNPPVGGTLEVDLTMNGTSVFLTPLTIDAGETTSVTAATPAVLDLVTGIPSGIVPDDAEFKPFVTAKNGSFAGTGLKIAVTGVKN